MKLIKTMLAMLFAVSICIGSVSCNNGNEKKSEYTFIYDVNYEDGNNRVQTVPAGTKVTSWKARRTGYKLDDWYLNKEGTGNPFDFNTPINKDITVYAKWLKEEEIIPIKVTFDFNYPGSDLPYDLTVNKGKIIEESKIPSVNRLGFVVEGWYTDPECSNKFDIATTPITEEIVLYANYTSTTNFEYDQDGNIIFENVTFNMVVNNGFNNIQEGVKSIVNKFNLLYSGKIKVNLIEQRSDNNHEITLKYQQTETINGTSYDYIPMQDVLNLANIDFDSSNFYEGAIKDNYLYGKLFTMPVVAMVPSIVYNKALMTKYNQEKLPTNYRELVTLLKAVNEGEKNTSGWNKAIVTDNEWMVTEISSHTIYNQNNSPFYYKNDVGNLVNDWNNDTTNITNAVNIMRELFSGSDSLGVMDNDHIERTKGVANGKTFMSIVGAAWILEQIIAATGKSEAYAFNDIGVMPLSNLFANDPSGENANKIFVKTFSLGVTSSGPDDLYKIAAAGVFTDFFVKNTVKLGEFFHYPLTKAVVESSEFQDSINPRIRSYLKNVGNPNDFVTYDGHSQEYNILNHINESFLPTYMEISVKEDDIQAYIMATANAINDMLF